MLPIPKITDLDMAFPARALEWMPKWEEVPEQFKKGQTPYNAFVSGWFYRGLNEKDFGRLRIKHATQEESQAAFKVIQATLGSFAPKHEHKMAAAAYMLSEWFTLEGE